jgi:hypothetical protein
MSYIIHGDHKQNKIWRRCMDKESIKALARKIDGMIYVIEDGKLALNVGVGQKRADKMQELLSDIQILVNEVESM